MNSMSNKLELHANRLEFGRGIAIWVSERIGDTRFAVAQPLTMTERESTAIIEPTMTLRPSQAQQLMDELWVCGIRPTEGAGSAGSLAATQRHLEDMRTIANRLLDDKLK